LKQWTSDQLQELFEVYYDVYHSRKTTM
jgi:hypothetical protein